MVQNVFHNQDDIAIVGPEWIERLKRIALENPQRRSRLCLHRSDDDSLHEMIIALARGCLFKPHRHPSKSEAFHMIAGRLVMIIFDDHGTPVRSLLLTPPDQGGIFCYRLCAQKYHAVLPLDSMVVYHEITNGPFVKNDAIFADWAPDDLSDLRCFLQKAAISCGIPAEMIEMTATEP